MNYAPLNLGRWMLWGTTALVFAVAPLVFTSSFALTLLTQMGSFIIFALSYNMLLGQGGMLSFGHAVYSGLGAYIAVHALNMIGKGTIVFPVTLLPLIGGAAGMLFGILFGYVTTRRAGTTFALISLGVGEMVFACVLMFPGFFGGEAGVSTNRVVGKPFLGISYGPALQVYYLVAVWCLISMVAMYALTQTPLGRMANAVRDNPERAEFVGYDTQKVRFLQLVLSSFFAGVAGALSCINFEIVSAENVSAIRSGGVLIAAFIGGVPFFFGPILGAIVFILFVAALSGFTKAWLLYLGLFFVLMVLYAPGGLASLVLMQIPILRARRLRTLALPYAAAAGAAALTMAGVIGIVEMVYRLSEQGASTILSVAGLEFDARSQMAWVICSLLLISGIAAIHYSSRFFARRWHEVQAELKSA